MIIVSLVSRFCDVVFFFNFVFALLMLLCLNYCTILRLCMDYADW